MILRTVDKMLENNNAIAIPAKLIIGKSKTGQPYYAVDVEISPDYSKRLFLDKAEVALIKSEGII